MVTRKTHKVRGATFETDIKNWFRAKGLDAERLARTGAKDEGDVVIRAGFLGGIGVLECKAPGKDGRIDLSGWTKEAQLEAKHYLESRSYLSKEILLPAVVIKARGKSLDDSYVVFRLADLFPEGDVRDTPIVYKP